MFVFLWISVIVIVLLLCGWMVFMIDFVCVVSVFL